MSHEPVQTPKPRRGPADPRRRARVTPRAPLRRAETWAREHWDAARRRLSDPKPPKPDAAQPAKAAKPEKRRRALKIAAAVLTVLAVAIAILVAIWDWNWFRGPLARIASARMDRQVTITGDLNVDIFSWQPRATVEGVRIAEAPWAGRGQMATFDKITVQIRLIPLLWGDVDMRLLQFDRPNVRLYADAQGRKNWNFGKDETRDEPMRLPPIRQFIIRDGRLNFTDVQRDLRFSGTINASERMGAANRGFELSGQGSMNRAPFRLQVTGGPLLNIEKDKPYPFNAYVRAGETYITADGAVPEPFDLGAFYTNATIRGPDMSELYRLTGVALPNTPPYNLRGRLSRNEQTWRIRNLTGRVGDSDLAGEISVQTGRERPLLKADLRSRSLDFDDLGTVFGGAPDPTETASAEQKAMAAQLNAQQRLFPDTTLDVRRMRAMDADVTYRASSIRDAPVSLRSGSVRVRLDDGMLRANPLRVDLPRGQVAGFVNLDARKATPVTQLDLRLTGARIEQLMPVRFDGRPPMTGALVARAQLTGAGNSVHKAFANADGQMVVVAPGGEIRKAFAELMGVNVTKGLGLLLTKNQEMTPLRCGVAHFETRNGVMTANNIVFDTGPVLVTGRGTVNLGTERMAFRVQGHAKEFRLVRVLLPITAEGPIRRPKLGVEPGKAVAQGGIAVALGALVSPLAAILPFIDPGLADDANCGALLGGAAKEGAPVRTAQMGR